jgi:hypothetical protein
MARKNIFFSKKKQTFLLKSINKHSNDMYLFWFIVCLASWFLRLTAHFFSKKKKNSFENVEKSLDFALQAMGVLLKNA